MKAANVWLDRLLADVRTSVLFCTRLPFSDATPIGGGDLALASWALQIAGLLVGGIASFVYRAVVCIGLPSWPAAALALAATVAITGCLHEDGLGDTADGFGGGRDREQKLVIMRDSRLGTYGACALLVSLLLRWSALATIADAGSVAIALVAAHTAARAPLPSFMRLVPSARTDGLAAAAGAPSRESAAIAWVLGATALLVGLGFAEAVAGLLLLFFATLPVARARLRAECAATR